LNRSNDIIATVIVLNTKTQKMSCGAKRRNSSFGFW
jgi:hypothetical protein